MAYEKVGLTTDRDTKIGGINKKTGKPNPTQLEGYYKGTETLETDLGQTKKHVFKTKDGVVGVYGSANLNFQMAKAKLGLITLIKFTGTAPSKKGSPMQLFDVRQDADNVDASSVADVGGQEDFSASELQDSGLNEQDAFEESSLEGDDDSGSDTVAHVTAIAPKAPAQGPTAAQKSRVEALLKAHRQKTA